ncbi:MAG: hypothetical protein JWL84_2710 [Rhodospirillales bacterium]|jgi:hypothetical protein|nr:hypothetical protein [Rhodospirillales bacterium]
MDSLFFACTVAAIGTLILSLILSERRKLGERPVGLLAMRTGGETEGLAGEAGPMPGSGGKKKLRPKIGESLVRRQGPPTPRRP